MANKMRSILFIVIGIIAIVLAVYFYQMGSLEYCSDTSYGGDAYTGIQNAAAATARNVRRIAEIVKEGFAATFFLSGLGFIGVGLTIPVKTKKKETESVQTPSE